MKFEKNVVHKLVLYEHKYETNMKMRRICAYLLHKSRNKEALILFYANHSWKHVIR